LVFMRDVQHIFKDADLSVFLDVLCINQESNETKRQGIDKLGAFLADSDTMVVLYTDIYLQRLWTVYEVASFLALHPTEDLVVLPVFKAGMFYFAVVACWLRFLAMVPLHIYLVTFNWWKKVLLEGLFMLLAVSYFRKWACDKLKMKANLEKFSVSRCTCACGADRPKVSRDISRLMKAMQVVDQMSSISDALKAFDCLVHDVLPAVLIPALGRLTFAYKHVAVLAILLHGADGVDQVAAHSGNGRYIFILALEKVWRGLFQFPLVVGLLEIAVSYNLDWSRLQGVCLVICVTLLGTGGCVLHNMILEGLQRPPLEKYDIVVLVVLNLAGPILLRVVFGKDLFGRGFGCFVAKQQRKPRTPNNHASLDTE